MWSRGCRNSRPRKPNDVEDIDQMTMYDKCDPSLRSALSHYVAVDEIAY